MQNKPGLRSQSAMEYLMTYGWSILIIAVVVVAIWQLGVFNASNFAPRAQPGSCKVVRQQVFGGGYQINLLGVCNELPQFVASASPIGSGYIVVSGTIPRLNQFTITGWIYNKPPQSGQSGDALLYINGCGTYLPRSTSTYSAGLDTCSCKWVSNSVNVGCTSWATVSSLKYSTWYFIVETLDSGGHLSTYAYQSGSSAPSTASYVFPSPIYNLGVTLAVIGSWATSNTYWLNGSISNVQLYNTSLDASSIQSLYAEGIGGAPIPSQFLVGWWPLNGDANDYSGSNNNGQAVNIIYSTTYT